MTKGICGQPYFTSNPILAYDDMRAASKAQFASVPGTEKGDPNKAMSGRGEGGRSSQAETVAWISRSR